MQVNASVAAPPTDRIIVVDILRAVALFGIIINHAAMSFLAGQPPTPDFNIFSPLDRFVNDAAELLTFGKFFAIFSFLFGLSFAIQLDRATHRGAGFAGRFAWRLTILLLIGFVHSLFFSGDVLMIYALLGFALIPCRKLKSRTLVILGLVFVLNLPGMLLGAAQLAAPPPTAEQQQRNEQMMQSFQESALEQYRIKQSGTTLEIFHMNLTDSMLNKAIFLIFTGRLWITFGYFLLGVWAGRVMLFRDSEPNRAFFRKLLLWAGIAAAITSGLHLLYPVQLTEVTLAALFAYFVFTLQQSTLAAAILSAVTLWYWRHPHGVLLPKLSAAGKMGLTTYLMQTMFGLVLFFGIGFGLLGKIGVTASVASGIAFFVFQIWFSRWWLARFNMGPFEWLWRSLTYFKLHPNGRTLSAA